MKEIQDFDVSILRKYGAYFHDGSLIDIKHVGNKVDLLITSAEIDPEEVKDPIKLSKDFRIQGILHLEGVENIKVSDRIGIKTLYKFHDSGEILDLEIEGNAVMLGINWSDYPPKPRTNDFTVIEMHAIKIWWENIPDLENPDW